MNIVPPKTDFEDNVAPLRQKPELRLMRGGNEPPVYGKDYLSSMKAGTEFLVRDRQGLIAPKFIVIEWIFGGLHHTGNVLLIPAKTPNDHHGWQWVDPKEFCKFFEFRGIIEEPEHETDSETARLVPEPSG